MLTAYERPSDSFTITVKLDADPLLKHNVNPAVVNEVIQSTKHSVEGLNLEYSNYELTHSSVNEAFFLAIHFHQLPTEE